MKIIEAINKLDDLKPNGYTQSAKIAWLSELDGKIKLEVIDTHENGDDVVFNGYTDDDIDTELLVPAPYDTLYISWLEAQIDYHNHEYTSYNNDMLMFNTKLSDFTAQYNRVNMPKGKKFLYF